MLYYHVWVRSEKYRGSEPLTYASEAKLAIGAIIEVPLRQSLVFGVVVGEVSRPRFRTKPINKVLDIPPFVPHSLKLAAWMQTFYATPIGVIMQLFIPPRLSRRYTSQPGLQHEEATEPSALSLPALTTQQSEALSTITEPDTYILHGRTGSGKTRIYIEKTKQALEGGTSALILVPEIGLVSHLAESFRRTFGQRVIVLHSQLTEKERLQAWLTILHANEPLVVIGPRSALFSPIKQLGLIVVDEEHDQAYKQEQAPYYHAVRVASQLRVIHRCILILGSATPSIHDYYLARARKKEIIRLDQLAIHSDHSRDIVIVDLKDSSQFLKSSHISIPLGRAIENSLSRGEQALLYLNRRGTARVTLCNNCGWQALCPRCDLPLTFHGDVFKLRCHTCGYQQAEPTACPVCGQPSIEFRSFGTKAIEREAQSLFPEATILRVDSDNKKGERLENNMHRIKSGSVDILVGTQLLTKGLDLSKLSTVGVIAADTSLFLPDYTAKERTYQLLTQVIGRVGRGHTSGTVIVQTFQPDSTLLRAALHDNWEDFYNEEIDERKQFLFPPFVHIMKVSCQRASSSNAEKAARACKHELESRKLGILIEGPAPAFHEKAGNHYKWQLIIKARDRQHLLDTISSLPSGWSYDIDPSDLL